MGAWQGWLTNTLQSEAQFVGIPDGQYYFEVKATDNVNNSAVEEVGPITVKSVTKYYTHGGTKVAMRRGAGVYYLHGDHLGSTSLTTDSSGVVVSEARYLPYGQERWSGGETPTDFGFTSQRNERGFGLYDYKARYYSAVLGRFVSPDSVVPEPGSSGGFNRYRYVGDNPLRYTDPSGHCAWDFCIVELALIGTGLALAVDFGVQAKANYDEGLSFGEAVYYENMDTQQLGASMLGGAAGGAAGATVVPVVGGAAGLLAADTAAVFGASQATATTIGAVTTAGAEVTTAGVANVAINSTKRNLVRVGNGEDLSMDSIAGDLSQHGGSDFMLGAGANLLGKGLEGGVNYFFPPVLPSGPAPPPQIVNVRFNMVETAIRPSLPGDEFHQATNAWAQTAAQIASDEDILEQIFKDPNEE